PRAARHPRGGTRAHAAAGRDRHVVFVLLAVAVVVDAVAGRVAGCVGARVTAVDDDAHHAARLPRRRARAHTARGVDRRVLVVGRAVAVLVDAVAVGVRRVPGIAFLTAV